MADGELAIYRGSLVKFHPILLVRDHGQPYDVSWEHLLRVTSDPASYDGVDLRQLCYHKLYPRAVVVLEYIGDDQAYTQWFIRIRIRDPPRNFCLANDSVAMTKDWLWPLPLCECTALRRDMLADEVLASSSLVNQFAFTTEPFPQVTMAAAGACETLLGPPDLWRATLGNPQMFRMLSAMVLGTIPLGVRPKSISDNVWDCPHGDGGDLSRNAWLSRPPTKQEWRQHALLKRGTVAHGLPIAARMVRKKGPSLLLALPEDVQRHLFDRMATVLVGVGSMHALRELLRLRLVCRLANEETTSAARAVVARVYAKFTEVNAASVFSHVSWEDHRNCRSLLLGYQLSPFAALEVWQSSRSYRNVMAVREGRRAYSTTGMCAAECREQWLDYMRMRRGMGSRFRAPAPAPLRKKRRRRLAKGEKLLVWICGTRRTETVIDRTTVSEVDAQAALDAIAATTAAAATAAATSAAIHSYVRLRLDGVTAPRTRRSQRTRESHM